MKHTYHRPDASLTDYVRTVLVLEGTSSSGDDRVPVFTGGMPTLLCRTEKDSLGHQHVVCLALFGKSVPSEYWFVNDQTTIVAYFFKPFVLASMFNIAAKKLSGDPVNISEWSPHKCVALTTQLNYADSIERMKAVIDNFVAQQLKQNFRACQIIQYATDQIMYNSDKEILVAVQDKLSVTERTFQRTFKKFVGITASHYRRICQFQLSFAHLRTKQFDKISDLAFDQGFADQSHFVRSFKEFTEMTPTEYLQKGLKTTS